MNEYRITKYDPNDRNEHGYYSSDYDHWMGYGDIGEIFQGNTLTLSEYLKVEQRYIDAVISLMRCGEINHLTVVGLEKENDNILDMNTTAQMENVYRKIMDASIVNILDIDALCKLILRRDIWAKLESETMFVHFGYDYYMYIGVDFECEDVLSQVEKTGLFVEEFESPYKFTEEDEENF